MDAKWPFMLITFGLILGLGLLIASLERTSVMNNWTSRRCELPVMAAAMFFKPDSDPRTKSDFAKENFDFCMKSYVDKFMALFMAPINTLFGKNMNATGSALDMVGSVREIAQRLYNTLSEFLDQYYRRFNASIYEISRIAQYLRMAFRRANAMAMSMLYTGITMFRGMLNTIQFVIKVIMIVVGIMIALIIILFFVLFPVIPLILAVLSAIVATVLSLSSVMSGDIAQQAENSKGGFCFSKETYVYVNRTSGNKHLSPIYIFKKVSEIKVGDELGNGCGTVTAVIKMNGTNVPLYKINGIYVSGTHLVKGTDGVWKSVASDERAELTDKTSDILYCFNTTSHKIPIGCTENAKNISKRILLFRDWEELEDDDLEGQYLWNYTVLKMLNKDKLYDKWKQCLDIYSEIPLVGSMVKVKTRNGFVEIDKLNLNEMVLDRNGKEQPILGTINAEIKEVLLENNTWTTELFELKNNVWIKGQSTVKKGNEIIHGNTLITESGEFIIWDDIGNTEKIVRDFTDVGYTEIHKTYPMVASRLRL
jgi:hypothetical protein